ncbi:beta-L-arabinofuranosidase domain-containing protein [Streptomyces sp. VRA16 Mangrove soil]|uniref:beta-L-arabinofuranosidase domain-containing protein n=1 Tax=Streptomyces sp. VRA16 Mangrove soil TaxID=2817434 RepID=UPI001A9DE7A5|nr:beta-L-arabinofuranosidase domain-containing protein [Streptomyces sp. VRA16 Mangrove soil]MBO1332093.1 glycoside hydrolase family 127 protein [Streptomyces sp. VRA16 Mangrove soil]
MTVTRRGVLQAATVACAATAFGAAPALTARADAAGPAADAFTRLPVGSITAHGWLDHQLRLQLAGLCGRYDEKSHFLVMDTCGWVHPELGGWEELPYWLRGFVPLAVATRDADALATCKRWIDAILATQQDDGFFGPRALRTSLNGGPDFWPFLPLLMALRTYEEYTGDERIVPFLTRFLTYMEAQGKGAFDSSWVSVRWGDGIDTARWLYERTGDAFLPRLVDKMHHYGADWTGEPPTPHNVNIAQGFREPAQYAQWAGGGAEDLVRASYRTYDQVLGEYGQFAGGGFAGDENYRPGFGDPRQGFETCGIVEFMASHELLTRITGDPVWADRCEDLAFNMLPAALDPQGKGIHYVTSANGVDLDNARKTEGQFQNGFAMQSFQPGVDQYRCCPHNYGMGWPYFTEELWLATPDGGLAAALYAPCSVETTVGGVRVTVREETDYPFDETVTLTVGVDRPADLPLRLRIPGWCEKPRLSVNGQAVSVGSGPSFAEIRRTWRDGDRVTLRLPQHTTLRTWSRNHDSVSVDHGPLTYSLKIAEKYVRTGGSDTFPEYDVHAASAWNYALVLGSSPTLARRPGPLPANPFTLDGTPLTLAAKARRLPEWIADDEHVVAPLQPSPARSRASVETVTLVPMGAARLRITSFPTAAPDGHPWTPEPPYHRVGNKHSGKVLAVDSMSTANDARVVQFDNSGTGDHAWQLLDAGDGRLRIRNGQSGKFLAVKDSSTADSAWAVQYEDNGRPDLLWRRIDQGDGWFLLRNEHSGKVLGVDGMSGDNSAQVVQFADNGTDDHLWRLES